VLQQTPKVPNFQRMGRQGLSSPLASVPMPGILVGVTKFHDPQASHFTVLRQHAGVRTMLRDSLDFTRGGKGAHRGRGENLEFSSIVLLFCGEERPMADLFSIAEVAVIDNEAELETTNKGTIMATKVRPGLGFEGHCSSPICASY
jgi:hypothetical protein